MASLSAAHTPANMKERRDVCTAVIDPDGNSVAQVESLAALLGSMLSVVPNIYEKVWKGKRPARRHVSLPMTRIMAAAIICRIS